MLSLKVAGDEEAYGGCCFEKHGENDPLGSRLKTSDNIIEADWLGQESKCPTYSFHDQSGQAAQRHHEMIGQVASDVNEPSARDDE